MKVYLRADEAAEREVLEKTSKSVQGVHERVPLIARDRRTKPRRACKAQRGLYLQTDRVRFELTVRFHVHTLSRRAP